MRWCKAQIHVGHEKQQLPVLVCHEQLLVPDGCQLGRAPCQLHLSQMLLGAGPQAAALRRLLRPLMSICPWAARRSTADLISPEEMCLQC